MEMDEHEIAQRIVLVISVDVINLYYVIISNEQFAPSAFPLLFVKKFGFLRMHHGMCFQALTPVEQVSIIWAGRSSHLFMPLDCRISVKAEFGTYRRAEGVSTVYLFPVFRVDPASFLSWMPSSRPTLQLEPDMAIAG